jgi:hypothetical protein
VKPAFDEVVIIERGGARRSLDVAAFLALPLDKRIGYILGRNVEFLRDGQRVSQAEALKSLR